MYVCLGLLTVIVRCEDTATFIREICKTSQEFLNLNHEFLSCRQMLSEVRVKNLYDQSDRNSSISYERVFSYFIMASGSLLLMCKLLFGSKGNILGIRNALSKPSDTDEQDEGIKQPVDVGEQKETNCSRNVNAASMSSIQRCLVCCSGGHVNLVVCPMLKCFIPKEGKAEVLPLSLCVKCLSTSKKDGWKCKHQYGRAAWRNDICKTTCMNYLLCKHCAEHKVVHDWWRIRSNPAKGFKNYSQLVKDLTLSVLKASVQGSITSEVLPLSSEEVQSRLQNFFRNRRR